MRIGFGYDVHKFVEGRPLILCGVTIPFELGLLGHSDADVATHALMDSILGALALGDIGRHFPDNDNKYKGANSLELLKDVINMAKSKKYEINNIDITIVMQKPKVLPYVSLMRENIANICNTSLDNVNIKATTEENLGFTGEMLGAKAYSVVTLKYVD
ncbi:MAG: 2-C-methyl-D-erythritol 2,4-cyclodiphosphate synthase [Lachnospirales bacterium]